MRNLPRPLLFILAIAALGAGMLRAEAQSCTLTIRAVQNSVKAGSKVSVKIELKNISDHDINLMSVPWGKEDHPELEGFRPLVIDAQGKEPA